MAMPLGRLVSGVWVLISLPAGRARMPLASFLLPMGNPVSPSTSRPKSRGVAPPSGATPPSSVGGCHGVMRPEEVAHLAHCLGNQVLGLLPGVDAHVGLRREAHDLHGHGVRVRRDIV